MRLWTIAATATFAPTLAHAHFGHLAGLAGHDHWIAGVAVGAAIAIGAWTAVKGRGRTQPKVRGAETPTKPTKGQSA